MLVDIFLFPSSFFEDTLHLPFTCVLRVCLFSFMFFYKFSSTHVLPMDINMPRKSGSSPASGRCGAEPFQPRRGRISHAAMRKVGGCHPPAPAIRRPVQVSGPSKDSLGTTLPNCFVSEFYESLENSKGKMGVSQHVGNTVAAGGRARVRPEVRFGL